DAMRKARKGRKRPQRGQSVNGWPDLATLWALEDGGRRRDRILAQHSLLMTVIERKALDRFRQAIDDSGTDWEFHLDVGIGYDLDHLQAEIERVFERHEDAAGIEPLYDRTLEALGDARRAVRQDNKDADATKVSLQALLNTTERLYDQVEDLFDKASRHLFIEDGLRKTVGWLATHDDPKDSLTTQKSRLLQAKQRFERSSMQ
ncbi:MAG: hypothetical protein O3A46_16990, partial [Candidatus Poribacteria bacterium]|nr:hypothetical protein [Candidatus Poribacteria bacterium]